jgi:acetoin:2,6-dichlorophenolindophenol oxidoreductase subunit beta
MDRELTYAEAIREAIHQAMERDPAVVLLGQGVNDTRRVYGTTAGLVEAFGRDRVIETPVAEDGATGVAVGMAEAGLRPVLVHGRMDFALLAMNQLINVAAKLRAMTGGRVRVPLVVRVIIGRGWGQGAQHSQGLHSLFMHVPGLRVVAPTTPADAKACLLSAILGSDPTVFMEHRLLHGHKGPVGDGLRLSEVGHAKVVTEGRDLTLVGISHALTECREAAVLLGRAGVSAEVIDPVWLSPLDVGQIWTSADKTGRLLVVDDAWTACGAGAEILASVAERSVWDKTGPMTVRRMGFAPTACPPTPTLERAFYPDTRSIAETAYWMVNGEGASMGHYVPMDLGSLFRGPF